MTKVYILSDYDEYGSENVIATTDKDKVIPMLKSYQNGVYYNEESVAKLTEVLELNESRNPINLLKGWGGATLHIVPLDVNPEEAARVHTACTMLIIDEASSVDEATYETYRDALPTKGIVDDEK